MRRFILPALLVSTALPAHAQDRSLWELLHPNQIAAKLLRSAILGLRSQVDITYSSLTVSMRDGVLAADDVKLTLYDNITDGDVCEVTLAGLEILTGDPFAINTITLSLAARSVEVGDTCLPADARPGLAMLGKTSLLLPEVAIDIAYDMPTAATQLSASTTFDGIAAFQAQADLAYATIWAGDGDEAVPGGDLRAASVTIEDLGGWERASAFLPQQFTNPDTAGAAASQMLGQMFEGLAQGNVLPKGAKSFVVEAARGWADFVSEPGRLVLETGFDPDFPIFIDAQTFEDGPFPVIDLLQPVVARVPAAERGAVPPALLAQALNAPDTLDNDARRMVGLALLTGTGAPRAVAQGAALLSGFVDAGDGEVALAVARALKGTDVETAYAAALVAGAAGAPGARSVLDSVEVGLPFAARMRLQKAASAAVAEPDLQASTRELAAHAEAHLSGVGAPRSLPHALLFGTLAAARGHAGAARLVDRIDRAIPQDGRAAWAELSAEISDTALAAWVASSQ